MPDVTKIDATIRFTPPNKTLSYAFGARRVALYCRVSSKMGKQLNSLSAQIDFITQDIIDYLGWEHVGTYTDIGSGKSIASRPGLKHMIADCEQGKIDLIYTKVRKVTHYSMKQPLATIEKTTEL